jgi:hypothetical protein
MKVLTDFHHGSLLRSLVMLFEGRLGAELYRPIGMEWYGAGYWAINNSVDTARQYLEIDNQPLDRTPPLNQLSAEGDGGVYRIYDPGNTTTHKGIRFDAFKETKFDYIIASIPDHIPLYADLVKRFQPQAKLIVQVGNNWDLGLLAGHNILASVKSVYGPHNINVCYYRQEFDTNIFCHGDVEPYPRRVSSYVNCLSEWPVGWTDFLRMEEGLDVPMLSFGGQCRDGNMNGPRELADSMRKDAMVFHVKDYGDGYGHVVHNAMACGRPIIYRSRFTDGTLVGDLLNERNSFDLDEGYWKDSMFVINRTLGDTAGLSLMSFHARAAFDENVDFADDARRVGEWLASL